MITTKSKKIVMCICKKANAPSLANFLKTSIAKPSKRLWQSIILSILKASIVKFSLCLIMDCNTSVCNDGRIDCMSVAIYNIALISNLNKSLGFHIQGEIDRKILLPTLSFFSLFADFLKLL